MVLYTPAARLVLSRDVHGLLVQASFFALKAPSDDSFAVSVNLQIVAHRRANITAQLRLVKGHNEMLIRQEI